MNRIQSNFRKEVNKAIYASKRKAKIGQGPFSNIHFAKYFSDTKKPLPGFIRFIFFIVKTLFKLAFFVTIFILISFSIILLVTTLKRYLNK